MSLLFQQIQDTNDEAPSSPASQIDPFTLPHDSFGFSGTSDSSITAPFSFSQQLGVRSTQAIVVDLKNKSNLHGQYATNLDSFAVASGEERNLMHAAWMQEILMKLDSSHKSESEGISDSLKKDAWAYASYTLLSWKLASYSGKISDAVIQAMRNCGIKDVPENSQIAKIKELTTYIGTQITNDKNRLKKKVIDSLAPQSNLRNIANLAKAVIGAQSILLTAELYVRLVFLRQVAAAIQSKPDHPANNDGTKWWEEIDKGLLDVRNEGDAERVSNNFIRVYTTDIKTYGDPELSGLKPAASLPLQKLVDSCAMTVEVPAKTKNIWKEWVNENGKRARVEEPTSAGQTGGQTGDMVDSGMNV
ncbi:hypothetical protein K435DRAFT_961932 [Dendrothele bispora CBS 962.96]|uniref:Uncharacterized protein n=1 Tax=Dendrothele bispora (strain CBS 962.96) TaxID=1314807 RepID=A0A4S8MPT1_DENBC|nr:hypothetical protein K435DRAFT_961932 [Dendrothele bispora CBS 962.96]